MSLYNTYRSQTFDDIVEQQYTKDILQSQIKNNDTHHNYIFFGSRGIGKTSIARILAKAANCVAHINWNPCNTCANCVSITGNKAMDVIEIDAASHTSVENIREEIIGRASYPPIQLRRKVYIIDEVHMLSKSAFNALLKIMEEPRPYMMFILATTDMHKVPDTIMSRCQVFNFKKISVGGMTERLEKICKLEWFGYELWGLQLIARLADGGMRDALKYLDQVSSLWTVTISHVSMLLGVTSDEMIAEFVQTIVVWDFTSIVKLLDQLITQGTDLIHFAKDLLVYIDHHFLDTGQTLKYIQLSDCIRTIMTHIKYYPHPLVLFKTELFKIMQGWNETLPPTDTSSHKLSPEVTLSTPPITKVTKQQIIPEVIQEASKHTSTTPDTQNKKDIDVTGIKEQLIAGVGITLQGILRKYCDVSIVDHTAQLITIDSNQLIILQSKSSEIEKILTHIIGRPLSLIITYMDKSKWLEAGLV